MRPTIWLTRRINDKCNRCGEQLQKKTCREEERERKTSQKVGEHERMIKTLPGDPTKSAERVDRGLPAPFVRCPLRVPSHAPFAILESLLSALSSRAPLKCFMAVRA